MDDCYIARRVSLGAINLLSPTCVQLRKGANAAGEKNKPESVHDRVKQSEVRRRSDQTAIVLQGNGVCEEMKLQHIKKPQGREGKTF